MEKLAATLLRSGMERCLKVAAVGPAAKLLFTFLLEANHEENSASGDMVPAAATARLPTDALSPQEAEIARLKAALRRSEAMRESQKLGFLVAYAAIKTLASELVLSLACLQQKELRRMDDREESVTMTRNALRHSDKASISAAGADTSRLVEQSIQQAITACRGSGDGSGAISGPGNVDSLSGGLELSHLTFAPAFQVSVDQPKSHEAIALAENSLYLGLLKGGVICQSAVAAVTLNMYDIESRSSLPQAANAETSSQEASRIKFAAKALQEQYAAEILALTDPVDGIVAAIRTENTGTIHQRWAPKEPLTLYPLASLQTLQGLQLCRSRENTKVSVIVLSGMSTAGIGGSNLRLEASRAEIWTTPDILNARKQVFAQLSELQDRAITETDMAKLEKLQVSFEDLRRQY